jgi:hypothetical protein
MVAVDLLVAQRSCLLLRTLEHPSRGMIEMLEVLEQLNLFRSGWLDVQMAKVDTNWSRPCALSNVQDVTDLLHLL